MIINIKLYKNLVATVEIVIGEFDFFELLLIALYEQIIKSVDLKQNY